VVEVAQDGAEAVEMAASRPYDLILMDVQMPKLDGLNATRQIRASSKGRALPIVAMTANAFHEDKMRCMQAGMDEFLAKPVDAVRLYQVIVRLLEENSLPV
jgi:CheY-like chemotaxis protein